MSKRNPSKSPFLLPPRLVAALADEVAKTVANRLPQMLKRTKKRKSTTIKGGKTETPIFLDTSAIIDGRIFDVIRLGLLSDLYIIPEEILLELKHIADSQDTVKRERGRKGLEMLEQVKRKKGVRLVIAASDGNTNNQEVDEQLIKTAKAYKGKIITCDYNLEKKASIQGVLAINVNALAQGLKVTAVPGEALHIKILHLGKDVTQGVGYLDDGTMIVVEQASESLGKTVDVVVSRVLQTSAGRILFAKKI